VRGCTIPGPGVSLCRSDFQHCFGFARGDVWRSKICIRAEGALPYPERLHRCNFAEFRQYNHSMNSKVACLVLLACSTLVAQSPTPRTGLIHTPQADLAYETYGVPSSATPVIAVNGGPGLSHIYMLQNDVWERLSKST